MFQKLVLPASWEIVHLDWIEPRKAEKLEDYVRRFSERLDTSQRFCIVGLSFGGIVATELTEILRPQKTIIISSISSLHELPDNYRRLAQLKLDRFIPAFLLNKVYPFTYWYFGVRARADKSLLRQIIQDTPAHFLKWAIHEILFWKRTVRPADIFHIHGVDDRIFPVEKLNADLLIEGGGHLVVYTRPEPVSRAIADHIGIS
jgi:pimeloyl-ACP methyl ester carboxylesterase